MSETILGASWYDENEAAAALELDPDLVHRFYERIISEGREPVAFYKGPGIPLLSGYTLRQLAGQPQQHPYKPTSRRRR